jgi:hypothetical protein
MAGRLPSGEDGDALAQWPYGKDTCKGHGVDGLLSCLAYNPPNTKDNKQTNGNPINAVVVTTWRSKRVSPGKEAVLLTSLPSKEDATTIAGGYRQRSLIENSGFKELKQATYLKYLSRRKGDRAENAAYIHIMLCVFAHTLFYTFLGWRKDKAPKRSKGNCMRSWRRQESINESGKILVVVEGEYYALYTIDELLAILVVKQKYKIRMNC